MIVGKLQRLVCKSSETTWKLWFWSHTLSEVKFTTFYVNNSCVSGIIIIVIILIIKCSLPQAACLNGNKAMVELLVDNGADLFLKKQIEKNYKIYNYIINKKNLGYAKAANQGINECNTNYILILGADCLIGAKDINVLVESQKKYNDCFITSPTFYDKNLNLNYSGGYLPENGDKISPLKLEGDMCVESIISTAILFTKKDINEIGKFDENFFLYYSDDDLCRRIKEKKKYKLFSLL